MPLPDFAGNDAPPFVQQLDRTAHHTDSGIEIIRTFYVEPYAKHQKLIKILQGYIDDDGKRVLPAQDTYIKNCYCNETEVNFADAEVMASSHDMAEDESGNAVNELIDQLQDTEEHPAEGGCGAIVKAHYRPLITAWDTAEDKEGATDKFDWIDPTYDPSVRQLPWCDGLYINAFSWVTGKLGTQSVPQDLGSPIAVPITTMTIKRLMVKRPPWQAIDQCGNAVNTVNFPSSLHNAVADDDNPGGIPDSPPYTLKFVDADVQPRIDTEGNRSYDITYTFERLAYRTDRLYGFDGEEKTGWVTWNHILIHPQWFSTSPVGWYEVQLGEDRRFNELALPAGWFGTNLTGGRLHPDANFIKLFDPDAT